MNKILKECLRLASRKNKPDLHPDWGCFHHFSFIIQDQAIVGMGLNRLGDSLIHGYPRRSKIHSEVDVYRKVRGILVPKPWDMVNIRLNKTSELRNSQPCTCCQQFIRAVGVRNVYFSTNDGFAKQCK
jgi:tRNA(Arg) A34 adenosine deaminase TadA